MALMTNSFSNKAIQPGNRNDICYLCALEVTGKDDREYRKNMKALEGALEGKQVLKIKRNGQETILCMKHIHQIADENPLPKDE